MYIDVLLPAVNSLVQQFRDTHQRCTYIDFVQQARSLGDALRGPGVPILDEAVPGIASIRQTRALKMTQSSSESTCDLRVYGCGDIEAHLMSDHGDGSTVPLSSTSSMTVAGGFEEETQASSFLMVQAV